MAIHVIMQKLEETETWVSYAFGLAEPLEGLVFIDRFTGEVSSVGSTPAIAERAMTVASQCQERGEYPDRADFNHWD